MKKFHLRNKNKLGGPGILQIAVKEVLNLRDSKSFEFRIGSRIDSSRLILSVFHPADPTIEHDVKDPVNNLNR
jgi:hypothetical protein